MLRRLIRFLRGYVTFTLRGKFPERFVNLSAKRGIPFLYIKPSQDGFEGAMLLCDYLQIRHNARKCSVVLRVDKRVGLPFLIKKYRKRKGLLCGLLAFLLLSLTLRNFVWSVEIKGVNTLSESAVYEVLRENSLYVGVPLSMVDEGHIERSVIKENPDIGWMSVNTMGTKVEVEIKEKTRKPEIVDYKSPCNIVAASDGIIVEMNTKQGTAKISEGSAVLRGQLLVSGAMVNALDEIDYVHSAARVMAKTRRKETFVIPESLNIKKPVEQVVRKKGVFLSFRFPLTFSPVDKENTVRRETLKVFLNNTTLPLGLETEYYTVYERVHASPDEDKAREILETEEALHRLFSLSDCEEITAKRYFVKTSCGYELEVEYACLEDIAKEQNIIVN